MINTSKNVIALTADPAHLRQAIGQAVQDVKVFHEELHGNYLGQPWQNKASRFGFLRAHAMHGLSDTCIDDPTRCLDLLMSACLLGSLDRTSRPIVDAFGLEGEKTVPPTQWGGLFRGVASILLYLWQKGHVILNPYFAPNLKSEDYDRYRSETLVDLIDLVSNSERYTDADIWNVTHHSKRLFWATDWTTWNRFKLEEFAELHARWLQERRKVREEKSSYPAPAIPFRLLFRAAQNELGEKTQIGPDQVEWYQKLFTSLADDPKTSGKKTAHQTFESAFSAWTVLLPHERDEDAVFASLSTVRRVSDEDQRWPGTITTRPLWEELPILECGGLWSSLFDQYLAEWHKRYESDAKYKQLLLFNDYLFLYLNWWHVKNPNASYNFPEKPGNIQRFLHIKKGVSAPREPRPLAFTDFLKRRTTSTVQQAGALRAAFDFFEWIIDEFHGTSEQHRFFEDGFKNPVRDKDVHYKNANKRAHARIRLNKRHASLFADYLLAIEAFYSKVENDAFARAGAALPMKPMPTTIEAEEYGFIPVVFHKGSVMRIDHVPVAHHLHEVALLSDFGISRSVPNLSALRLLCFMMETGLRGANVLWLDRNNFALAETDYSLCKRVYINTDKAGDAFPLPVSDEAYSLLMRQRHAVNLIIGQQILKPVPYQHRKHGRFEDVNTLFYAPNCTKRHFPPLLPDAYRAIFRLALATYSIWLADETGEDVDLARASDGWDLSDVMENRRTKAVNLLQAQHTPHSLRSTIISEHISVLPIRLVGQLAGQRNISTTAYYHQVDEEHLYRVLNNLPVEASTQFGFRADDPAYIQAATPSSALRRAWNRDPREAETAFGFTSMTFGTESAQDAANGLDKLREVEASEVAFFDTNICPFAGQCPKDVIKELGEPNRCGLCRYAVKSVDQLPAISAKVRFLEERSRRLGAQANKVYRNGSHEESQRLSDMADMDATEAIGWHLTETILEKKLSDLRSGESSDKLHVEAPDMLKRRLAKIELPNSSVARLLLRISEANAYPSMQDELVKQRASRLKRMMRGSEEPVFAGDSDPIEELCSYIAARMEIQGLTTEAVVRQLESHQELIPEPKIENASPLRQLVRAQEH